tara:strand:+ start:6801 stop:6917 length:117 start_codon:yes stop_codon:yes gene_type:complete
MEQFCVKCGWWRSQADDECKKRHFKKKREVSNENNRSK